MAVYRSVISPGPVRGWAGPLLITALGAWLQFARLSTPQDVVVLTGSPIPDPAWLARMWRSTWI
jgi:hypothetical protein